MSTENEIYQNRLNTITENNFNYPNSFIREHFITDLNPYINLTREELEQNPITVSVAGRLMSHRRQGKIIFSNMVDMTGRIQLVISRDESEGFESFKNLNLGDIVGVHGTLFRTMRGEFSVHVSTFELLTVALRPLPEKFHGLTDTETCYRQRYLDLMMSEDTRNRFRLRSTIVKTIRNYFDNLNYMEVETNILQSIPSGAKARKFETHMDSLDLDLSLRVAPELALKRLVVGGLERVYEIGKNFRNEGLSTRHNPEFTMIEFYEAYADYNTMMTRIENMIRMVANQVGTTNITYGDYELDFEQSFTRITMRDSVVKYVYGASNCNMEDLLSVRELARQNGIKVMNNWSVGHIINSLFEEFVESQLIQPTFITEYPVEVSPLARRNNDNPNVTDRFELFIVGRELANGFSELNDSVDQSARFLAQIEEFNAGDVEAMPYDSDYITALEYGLPPTAGSGVGIDRLVMIFTNSQSIKDIILFPQMRPE